MSIFLLCKIQELNVELLVRTLSAEEDGTLAINLLDLSAAQSYLADAPLASPNAEKSLNLSRNVNPHYSLELQRFAEIVVTPLLGKSQGFQDFVEQKRRRFTTGRA